MDAIFQLIFYLGIAFLAITIAVYVLAVSLLGRAVRLSSEEQVNEEEKRKEDVERRIKDLQVKLDEAKTQGHVDVRKLTSDLEVLEREEAQHKWKLRWIKMKPKLLTSGWGVLFPGFFFLTSIILSTFAIYQSSIKNYNYQFHYLWFSVLSIALGMLLVCLTLKVIEGIAITSEETSFTREAEALKAAMMELEEQKKPELELDFRELVPPLHLYTDSESSFTFSVGLSKGNIANNPTVYFLAPKGFEFPQAIKGPMPSGGYKDMVSVKYELNNIRKPFSRLLTIRMKAPSKPDTYTLLYALVCDGFDSDYIELEVVVEKTEIPF